MQTHEVTLKTGELFGVIRAFQGITGSRGVMLSYKIGELIEPVEKCHKTTVESLSDHINEDGMVDLEDDEAADEINRVLTEEVTLTLPIITLTELDNADLEVEDDSIIRFLLNVGILTKE